MDRIPDQDLLRAYVARDDRAALGELVARHIDMVYAAARRQTGDAHLAEDVTQAVFILLSRKAHTIRGDAALARWLFAVTRYAANNARKLASRRRYHERRAAELACEARAVEQPADDALVALLDEAIAALPQRDRTGVILSYFQNKTYREIGAAIGSSEEAARKRVDRAVERMRGFFAARGTAVGNASISAALCNPAAATPPALVDSTVNLVGLSGTAPGGVVGVIAKGVTQMWMIARMKIAAAAAAAVLAGGLVTAEVSRPSEPPAAPVFLSQRADGLVATLESGVRVQFVGLCKTRDEAWFDPSGVKIAEPSGRFAEINLTRPHQYHAMFRVDGGNLPAVDFKIGGAERVLVYTLDDGPDAQDILARFTLGDGQTDAELEVLVADGDWQTVATTEHEPHRSPRKVETEHGGFAFTHVSEAAGRSLIYVATDCKSDAMSVFAVDSNGQEHFCTNVWDDQVGSFTAIKYEFDLPPERIVAFAVKVRPFTSRITVKDFALDRSQQRQPKVVVEKIEPK